MQLNKETLKPSVILLSFYSVCLSNSGTTLTSFELVLFLPLFSVKSQNKRLLTEHFYAQMTLEELHKNPLQD